ncbi:MAG: hypothetical protein NC485_10325 [Ruminococcus flavefaciens]|nr:hypothetical protein [Ruminococcus flavefaciens]MCM1059293.1 hypothetical protein [Eubacterium sp.]
MDYEEVLNSFSKKERIKSAYLISGLAAIAFVVFAFAFENVFFMIGFVIGFVIYECLESSVRGATVNCINMSERLYNVPETDFGNMFLQFEKEYGSYVAKKQIEIQLEILYRKYKKLITTDE